MRKLLMAISTILKSLPSSLLFSHSFRMQEQGVTTKSFVCLTHARCRAHRAGAFYLSTPLRNISSLSISPRSQHPSHHPLCPNSTLTKRLAYGDRIRELLDFKRESVIASGQVIQVRATFLTGSPTWLINVFNAISANIVFIRTKS